MPVERQLALLSFVFLLRRIRPVLHKNLLMICMLLLCHAATAEDLSLSVVLKRVESGNREVLAARRAVQLSSAQIQQADVRPNPTLSLNSTGINRDPGIGSGPFSNKRIDNSVRLDQVIERGSKRALRVKNAQDLEAASRHDFFDVLRRQQIAASAAYYALHSAQDKVVILEDTAELMDRTLAAAQKRVNAGDLAPSELARIQVDAERSRNDLRLAQGDASRARIALSLLIGKEAQAGELRASDAWPELDPQDTELGSTQIDTWIDARSDVLAARKRIDAAVSALQLARSQRTRDVSVGMQLERFPGSSPVNSIGIGISVPLFVGNDFSGDIQFAETERYSAIDGLGRARAEARAEIAAASAVLSVSRDRVQRFQTSLMVAAGKSAEAAEFAFERGATSVLELLDARRSFRSVQLEALDARADYAAALVAWRYAIHPLDAETAGGALAAGLAPSYP